MMIRKKLICAITMCLLLFLAACDLTGSLSEKEERYIIDYMLDRDIIESDIDLVGSPVGEGELITYTADTIINGQKCTVKVRQKNSKDENFRIFTVVICDENNNKIKNCEIQVDRQ